MTARAWASFDRFELSLSAADAANGSHQGRCDDDIAALRLVPYIASQLSALDPNTVREELRGYGAWDAEELADHDANLDRVLWLGCGMIVDGAA